MSKTSDGGAAFPGSFSGHCEIRDHAAPCGCYVETGMTLRDYFAIRALPVVALGCSAVEAAKQAYSIADAMIAVRSNNGS